MVMKTLRMGFKGLKLSNCARIVRGIIVIEEDTKDIGQKGQA